MNPKEPQGMLRNPYFNGQTNKCKENHLLELPRFYPAPKNR